MYDSVYEPELQEHISAGQTLRVLVVDDSKVVRAAIRERLELGNLEFVEAESGRQALELIDARLPDLLLLDMVMPVTVREALAANGLPADALRLELKEDVLTGESPMIAKTLEELERMHISRLIDDFGTGYASLSCLKRYCVDAVKIDRRFIRGPADDSQDAKLVRAITAMASSLDVSVIAEGVESATQLSLLHDCNCQYGQGHYFSRPLPAERFRDLVTGRVDGYQGQKPLRLASAGPVSSGA